MEAAFELPIQSPTADDGMAEPANARPLPRPPPARLAEHASLPAAKRSTEALLASGTRKGPATGAWTTGRGTKAGLLADTGLGGVGGGSLREAKHRWPSAARDAERQAARSGTRTKTRISPPIMLRPLLPVTERTSQEENRLSRRDRKGPNDADRLEITPDGSSAGREGRQFTVANVGNNGRIYLRPTVRPAHLRFPQPNFVFPMTPPSTAGLDMLLSDEQQRKLKVQPMPTKQADDSSFLFGSDWTPDPTPSPTVGHLPAKSYSQKGGEAGRLGGRAIGGHRRAVSDSTVPDASVARESDPGGFKIVITKPADDKRAKTVEDIPQGGSPPLLEISIPSWKLGTPRFTLRGTPVLRGSSYAPTEELRSSRRSYLDQAFDRYPAEREAVTASFRRSLFCGQPPEAPMPSPLLSPRIRLAEPPTSPGHAAYHSSFLVVEPSMFDSLTFKPDCDDRSIVRFSPITQAITAATPPRLVAEITSPKFMDYDLVSDFFLTYRSFLEPLDLLRMLIARLRWAIARDDEAGTVTRVRTFVALRHWILNYFMDDFVIDYSLRVLFCSLLNDFFDELSQDPRDRNVQLKILTELKKCWRRSCAQYWDGPEFDDALASDVHISPGGIAGHRNPALDPSFWEQVVVGDFIDDADDESEDPLQTGDAAAGEVDGDFRADGERTGHIDSIVLGGRPATPERHGRPTDAERRQASPTSVTSLDFVSCSFPTKNLRLAQAGLSYSSAAHPVDPSIFYQGAGPVAPVATTPRALVGKRVRPQTTHNRDTSLTSSLEDHAATVERLYRNEELLMSLPFAGSLVRGAIFPPGQPYVEVLEDADGDPSRQTTLFQPHPFETAESQKEKASAMSGQGMRKLLGSVRRALSTRGQTVSPTQGTFINISPIGPRGATTNRLPGTAIVPQARPRLNGVRSPVRIDLLGARIAEDFKTAVREDASVGSGRQEDEGSATDLPIQMQLDENKEEQIASSHYSESFLLGIAPDDDFMRPMSDTGITTGSKSIVIVDGTAHMDFPAMTGALPGISSSVEAFANAFATAGADPTPPTTPPGRSVGTPRRSSYALSQQVPRPSLSTNAVPALVPAADTLATESITGPATTVAEGSVIPSSDMLDYQSEEIIFARPSIDNVTDRSDIVDNKTPANSTAASSPVAARMPPGWARGHARQTSSRSYVSGRSFGRRRFASFTSGMVHQALRSFDATTLSEESAENAVEDSSEVPAPAPLRVLRRRPGGDLRAVTNVGDLDQAILRRSRSVGSLTTFTDSIRSSYLCSRAPDSVGLIDAGNRDSSRDKKATFSVGMITEKKKPKRRLSLFSTHSSKPMMRPSFEVEAQKLAQIPDDVDDDGGVESALLKLEGKFEKRDKQSESSPTSSTTKLAISAPLSGLIAPAASRSDNAMQEDKQQHRRRCVDGELVPPNFSMISIDSRLDSAAGESLAGQRSEIQVPSLPPPAFSPPPGVRPAAVPRMTEDVHSFLSGESGESYSSIPLLDRGLTDDGRSRAGATTDEWGERSVFNENDNDDASPTPTRRNIGEHNSVPSSYEVVKKTESIEKIQPGETMPMPRSPGQDSEVSFLDDESDRASDLSSELSVDVAVEDDAGIFGEALQRPGRSNTVASQLPAHPLGDPQLEPVRAQPQPAPQQTQDSNVLKTSLADNPPSPPMTLVQALRMSPETAKIPEVHDHQLWGEKPLPPTPSVVSPEPQQQSRESELLEAQAALDAVPNKLAVPGTAGKFSVHLPFILAFESEVLAQQFTLIEKDALHEIDWKELIDMRWKDAENSDSRSWVQFLRNTDARGVEVVIARFNIMVKWTVSEVVLTQDLEERARCLIKFIHIAAHCRRCRNFATMSQIAIALTSNEVSRLTETWSLVPPSDQRVLRDLETLVSPTRNFYNLRAEMEAVGIDNADAGCIPFVGIYTHDLLFNAQRPSEIASSPTTAPLINFERCRIAASIIKTLLRLVEASAQYSFQPIEGITERCLWMSALSDDAIRKHSEALE